MNLPGSDLGNFGRRNYDTTVRYVRTPNEDSSFSESPNPMILLPILFCAHCQSSLARGLQILQQTTHISPRTCLIPPFFSQDDRYCSSYPYFLLIVWYKEVVDLRRHHHHRDGYHHPRRHRVRTTLYLWEG